MHEGWIPRGNYKSLNNRSSVNYNIVNNDNNYSCGILDSKIMDVKLTNRKKSIAEFDDLYHVFHPNFSKQYNSAFIDNNKVFNKYTGIFTNMYDAENKNGNLIELFKNSDNNNANKKDDQNKKIRNKTSNIINYNSSNNNFNKIVPSANNINNKVISQNSLSNLNEPGINRKNSDNNELKKNNSSHRLESSLKSNNDQLKINKIQNFGISHKVNSQKFQDSHFHQNKNNIFKNDNLNNKLLLKNNKNSRESSIKNQK